jgi:hypothetical protein
MRELQTWERRDTVNASGFRERSLFMAEGGTEEKRLGKQNFE